MSLKSRALKSRISSSLSNRVVNSFLKHVHQSSPKLWGVGCKNQKRSLVTYASLLAIYKDMTGQSYKQLHDNLPDKIKWSMNTLHHNQRVLRHKMSDWADTVMIKQNWEKYKKKTNSKRCRILEKKASFFIRFL